MISKSWLKLVKSLQIKKFRVKEGLFLVEGTKSVLELVNSSFNIKAIFCTQTFYNDYAAQLVKTKALIEVTTEQDLEAGGTFTTNNAVIAVAYIKPQKKIILELSEIGLMLDSVKDPGNLGTIIRIADWYGINKIVMSPDCVDFYNPKVITSSMGSFTRVEFFYADLIGYVQQLETNTMLIGAFMDGENVHSFPYPDGIYILIIMKIYTPKSFMLLG